MKNEATGSARRFGVIQWRSQPLYTETGARSTVCTLQCFILLMITRPSFSGTAPPFGL